MITKIQDRFAGRKCSRPWLALVLLLCSAVQAADTADSSGLIPLFNGRDLSGWDTWLGERTVPGMPIKLWGSWSNNIGLNNDESGVYSVVQVDGEPAIRISGEIWGALISQAEYGNYHLRLQFKWGDDRYAPRAEKPRNTGLLYHSVGDYGAFWSYWMRSVEFEIMTGSTGDFTAVDAVTGSIRTVWDWDVPYPWQRYEPEGEPTSVGGMVFRVSKRADYEVPGEWNNIDLYVYEDASIHLVNGEEVMRIEDLRDGSSGDALGLVKGKLQLQSEGAEVFFRRIFIKPISALPVLR